MWTCSAPIAISATTRAPCRWTRRSSAPTCSATDALSGLRDDRSVMGVLALPEVAQVVEAEEDREALRSLLLETLEGALDEVAAMRAVEGEALRKDLEARADALERIERAIAAARAAVARRLPRAPARERGRASCRADGRIAPRPGNGDHGRPPGHRRGAGAPYEPRRPTARPASAIPPPPGGGWTSWRRSSTARSTPSPPSRRTSRSPAWPWTARRRSKSCASRCRTSNSRAATPTITTTGRTLMKARGIILWSVEDFCS